MWATKSYSVNSYLSFFFFKLCIFNWISLGVMYQSTWGILHNEEIIIVDILFIVYVCICYHNCM